MAERSAGLSVRSEVSRVWSRSMAMSLIPADRASDMAIQHGDSKTCRPAAELPVVVAPVRGMDPFCRAPPPSSTNRARPPVTQDHRVGRRTCGPTRIRFREPLVNAPFPHVAELLTGAERGFRLGERIDAERTSLLRWQAVVGDRRVGRLFSPGVGKRDSGPRAAYSHCASLGRSTRLPETRLSQLQNARAS